MISVQLIPAFGVLICIAAAGCKAKDSPASAEAIAEGGATTDAPAASGGEVTPTDIAMYPLDMKKMRSWVNATKAIVAAYEKDSLAAMKNRPAQNETPAQQIARMERDPLSRRILRENGLTGRDYVMILGSYMHAGMVGGAMSMNPNAKLPEGSNPENIKFVQANRTELEKLFKEAGFGNK